MGIKRYTATEDTTITNAYKPNLTSRATGSNMGLSDSLEVFRIYGQESSGSSELSRILVKFPVTGSNSIKSDRAAGTIPESGSVNFYLRMFNAEHPFTLPRNFSLTVAAISRSWNEGTGMDMDAYSDLGATNWLSASSGSAGAVLWTSQGGDLHASPTYTVDFDKGTEDIELDITALVEQWISGSAAGGSGMGPGPGTTKGKQNYGAAIYLTNETAYSSSYTKKFFARGSEYFFKRPIIEARWDSARKDNRGNFFYSSSLAPAVDNLNTLYLYNYVRGRLVDIPGLGSTNKIYVSLFSGTADNTTTSGSALNLSAGGGVVTTGHINATGSKIATGIYSCSLALTAANPNNVGHYPGTNLTKIFDVWHTKSDGASIGSIVYHTGSFKPQVLDSSVPNPYSKYVLNITNLRDVYYTDETVQFRVYTRQKDWNPTIWTKASIDPELEIIESGAYKVVRIIDNFDAIPFGTGSDLQTQVSYDVSGSYFTLDMNMLETGYAYGIKFAFYDGVAATWNEYPDVFKFRVED
tara:strand:+ start:472 stop:2043 length:1572 start_codon:yes stop_codon:yes gene_type:complete